MAAYCKCLESDIRNSTQLLGVLYLWQCFGVIFVASRDKYFTVMLTRQSIFFIEICFFDTQNTFYLIVKELKNAFFMSFTL